MVFPKVFTKPKNPSRKPKIPKKTKENQKNIRKNQKNKVFKGFRLTLGYGFGFFVFLVFPKVFTKPKNPSRKPKIPKKTKENQKTLGKTKKTKFLKVSDPPLDMVCFFVFLVFPKVFTKPKNPSRKPKIPKKTKKTLGKTKKTKKQTHIQGWV